LRYTYYFFDGKNHVLEILIILPFAYKGYVLSCTMMLELFGLQAHKREPKLVNNMGNAVGIFHPCGGRLDRSMIVPWYTFR
jgi:hypothetical protein